MSSESALGARISAEEALRGIVGAEHVRPSGVHDLIDGVPASLVVEPGNEAEVAAVLRFANDAGLRVAPRGGGTKLCWGNPPAPVDLIVSTLRLNQIIEHAWADLTVTVEAGCTIRNLQERLVQHGQRLALDALWPDPATVGGVLATNDSGVLRLRFGALRDLIIGVTLALPDGTLARSGGKVVKNVAGYDLPKLATGALGTLGVITRAVFRLHPLPQGDRTLSISAPSLAEMQRCFAAIQDSQLAPSAVQARLSVSDAPEVDVLFEGTPPGLDAQEAHLRALAEPLHVAEASGTMWSAREELCSSGGACAIAKISMLPAEIAKVFEKMGRLTPVRDLQWQAVMQATGLGFLRIEGSAEALHQALAELRAMLEHSGGSLFVMSRPADMPALDAWGDVSETIGLMRAIKHQLDPKGTLNPGRFAGGI